MKAMLIGTVLLGALAITPVFADETAGAAGDTTKATDTSSTATDIAVGVGTLALIGGVIAGSTDNGTSGTTGTTGTR